MSGAFRRAPRLRLSTVRAKLLAQILPVAALALAAVALIAITNGTSTARSSAAKQMSALAAAEANQLGAESASRQSVGETMAAMMEGYTSGNRPETLRMLQSIARAYPDILGSYVVYEPDAFDGPDAAHRGTRAPIRTAASSPTGIG